MIARPRPFVTNELIKRLVGGVNKYTSFPSGHTCSAGIIYSLICMPYVFTKFNTKKWKVFWYVVPVFYTGIVGLSRIVVGAHFLSDVLVGGTIAYLASELAKYIFFIKKIEISKK